MTDSPHLTRTKRLEHAAREERLARALRDNLRRRKEQARTKQDRPPEPPHRPANDEPPA